VQQQFQQGVKVLKRVNVAGRGMPRPADDAAMLLA
jgi:hypothetical protein